MTDAEIKAFSAQHAPELAKNITRLCGQVIAKGIQGHLEHACALQQRVINLERALNRIDSWDEHDSSLGADYGSNGVRDYYRRVAREALAAQPKAEPVASSIYVEVRECQSCGHIGINDENDTAACNTCDWSGPSPKEDHCQGCGRDGTMTSACPQCGCRTHLLASGNVATTAAQQAGPPSWRCSAPPCKCDASTFARCAYATTVKRAESTQADPALRTETRLSLMRALDGCCKAGWMSDAEIAEVRAALGAEPAQAAVPDGFKLLEDGKTLIPADWTWCRLEWEPGYPEDIAFGPPRMMARLKKWLDKHFANLAAQPKAEPVFKP